MAFSVKPNIVYESTQGLNWLFFILPVAGLVLVTAGFIVCYCKRVLCFEEPKPKSTSVLDWVPKDDSELSQNDMKEEMEIN